MEHMTPEQFFTIVIGTLAIILVKTLWEWRMPIADRLRPMFQAITDRLRPMFQRRAPASNVAGYVTHGDREIGRNDGVTPDYNAVTETPETAKYAGPSPAELDRMLTKARHEAVAGAVGTLVGAGFIAADQRSKALLKVGIQGQRYTELLPKVNAAQAAAQAEQAPPAAPPEPPRVVKVNAGRPDEREVPLAMEPAP